MADVQLQLTRPSLNGPSESSRASFAPSSGLESCVRRQMTLNGQAGMSPAHTRPCATGRWWLVNMPPPSFLAWLDIGKAGHATLP
jgi:hypothetical protein